MALRRWMPTKHTVHSETIGWPNIFRQFVVLTNEDSGSAFKRDCLAGAWAFPPSKLLTQRST